MIQPDQKAVLVNYVRRFVDEFVNTGVVNWIVAHPEVCISFWVRCDNGRQLRRLRQHGGTERRAWNKSGLGKIFKLPEALVIQKEEGLVSFYRPPQRKSVLIHPEGWPHRVSERIEIDERARVQYVVAEILVHTAVIFGIGARDGNLFCSLDRFCPD